MKPRDQSAYSPGYWVKTALKADPRFKYAIIVLGLGSVVAILLTFGISVPALIFGVIILVCLMVLYLIFAGAAGLDGRDFQLPAKILVYFVLFITIAVVTLTFTSVFGNAPLHLRDLITKSFGTKTVAAEPTSPPPETSQREKIEAEIFQRLRQPVGMLSFYWRYATPKDITVKKGQDRLGLPGIANIVLSQFKKCAGPLLYTSATMPYEDSGGFRLDSTVYLLNQYRDLLTGAGEEAERLNLQRAITCLQAVEGEVSDADAAARDFVSAGANDHTPAGKSAGLRLCGEVFALSKNLESALYCWAFRENGEIMVDGNSWPKLEGLPAAGPSDSPGDVVENRMYERLKTWSQSENKAITINDPAE